MRSSTNSRTLCPPSWTSFGLSAPSWTEPTSQRRSSSTSRPERSDRRQAQTSISRRGAVLIVEYEARVRDDITPGVQISNTVGGIWTSLDGDNATGLETGERTGSLSRDANDYIHGSTLELASDTTFTIVKTIDGPTTEFAIGDTVTYFLDVTVFEGVTNGILIADTANAGMRIDATSLRIEPSGYSTAIR